MQYIYFGSVFAAAVVFVLIGLLLFLQRSRGERSRTILAGITFLSAVNYIRLIAVFQFDNSSGGGSVMQVPFLLIGIFVIAIYLVYPIEVISPGWLNWKRLLKIYTPFLGLLLFYRLTLWAGVDYISYQTFGEMMANVWSFQVIFRIVLALLIFLPVLLIYYVPYTRRYSNTDHKWINGYVMAVAINMIAYLLVNLIDTFLSCSLYVAVSVLCSLYITYQELYVRLIRQPIDIEPTEDYLLEPQNEPEPQADSDFEPESESEPESEPYMQQVPKARETELFERLEQYMNNTQAWQNPDLSVDKLISVLYTNRTSLLKVIQLHGYSGYTSYVNGKRVAEFIQIINRQKSFNYQQAFFDAGFRSKTTAQRNFKVITGMTPSEYFQKQVDKSESHSNE